MSWFGIGSGGAPEEADGAEIVKKLSARVASATLLDDRRDSIRALKSLSRKYRREVTEFGLASILELVREETDTECRALALDSIIVLIGADDDEGTEIHCPVARDTALHISKSKNLISLFFSVVDNSERKAKLSALRLLTAVARNYPTEIQNVIQERPAGVSQLVDGIGSSNELLRNESLLLIIAVAENNQILQKIIAFENTFEIALNVAGAEGGIDGGPVSEDCFALLLTLLRNNQSNVGFFRETALIPRLTPFLDAVCGEGEENWSTGKINCCLLFLGIIRALVSPTLPGNVSIPSRKAIRQCGLFAKLMNFIMGVVVPEIILTEVIVAVSECVRQYPDSQEDLAALVAPVPPHQPALVVLLRSMVNSKQPLPLRLAVLYCTCSLLLKNSVAQKATVESLLPDSEAPPTPFTTGSIICNGLFNPDPLTSWLAAAAMSQAVFDAPEQQAALVRVNLTTQTGQVTLSSLLTQSLAHSQSPHARLGILQFLATWCAGCSAAARAFIAEGKLVSTLQLLLDGSPSDSLMVLIQGVAALVMGCLALEDQTNAVVTSLRKRPGPDQFLDALAGVGKSPSYAAAAGNACPSATDPEELLIYNSFTVVYRQYEAKVGRYVANFEDVQAEMAEKRANEEKIKTLENQLTQFQEATVAIKTAAATVDHLKAENDRLTAEINERPKINLPEGLSENEIRAKLEQELKPEVEKELREKLVIDISETVKDELRVSFGPEIRKDLEENILEALEDEIRSKIAAEKTQDIVQEIPAESSVEDSVEHKTQLAELREELSETNQQASSLLQQLNTMTSNFTVLKEDYDRLKLEHAGLVGTSSNNSLKHEAQLGQLQTLLQTATTEIQSRDARIAALQSQVSSPNTQGSAEVIKLTEALNKMEMSAKMAIGDKQVQIDRLQSQLGQLQGEVRQTDTKETDSKEISRLTQTITELAMSVEDKEAEIYRLQITLKNSEEDWQSQLGQLQGLLEKSEEDRSNLEIYTAGFDALEGENQTLREQVEAISKEKLDLSQKLQNIPVIPIPSAAGHENIVAELEELKKDQEDLLELLSDQQLKLSDYRTRLKAAGQPITDEEDFEME